MVFTKFFDSFKAQQQATIPQKQPVVVDDTAALLQTNQSPEPPKRRWSYVTYLDAGTLHSQDDNLMVGL
ncbi:hypothetical protein FT663_02669 [Candidozyma haemuli var. vulneris]|nr:hypothetical protein FT662_04717 [[Candida] haemuloni var. vulneris]KAF3991587.1 hypothetical protein FT663_02669 [[Candida] haemuloni var. vulneris]